MALTFVTVIGGGAIGGFGPTISYGWPGAVDPSVLQIASLMLYRGGGAAPNDTATLPGWNLVGRAHWRQDWWNHVSGGPPDWVTIEVWWRWGVNHQVLGTTTATSYGGNLVHVSGALDPPICSGFAATANNPSSIAGPWELFDNPLSVTSTAVGGAFWRPQGHTGPVSDQVGSGTLPAVGPGVVSHTFDEPDDRVLYPILFVIREKPDPTTGGWQLGSVGWGPA